MALYVSFTHLLHNMTCAATTSEVTTLWQQTNAYRAFYKAYYY